MKPRTMIILAAVAVILIGIAMLNNRSERASEQLETGPIFAGLNKDAVAEIILSNQDKEVRILKQGEDWVVASEDQYPADQRAVTRILDSLEKFDRRYLRSRNPEQQATFEVDAESGTGVILADRSGNPLADFRMGKNGPDYQSQYIRPSDAEEVYLIPEYLRSVFDAGKDTWRDKAIFSFETEKARQLVIRPAEGPVIAIAKDDEGNFTLTAPDSAAAKKSIVESTLRTLSNLRCDAFPDSLPSMSDAGLDPPRQSVEVLLDDGAAYTLLIGNLNEDDTRHYVKKESDETLFLLSKGRITSLIRDVDALKETPPEQPPAMEEEEG